MKNANEGMKREKFHLKIELNTITKKREDSTNIETKLDKHGNKISMYETVKEVDEEIIMKENITSFSRDNISSLQADNVENIGEINNLLIIEAGVTKKWIIER